MLQIQLSPGLPGGRWAYLRPLCGHDEVWINDDARIEAVAFLDRLLVEAPGTTVGPGKAEALAICDCDRLFAALYLSYFGELIEGIATCWKCNEPFELSLSLPELMADLEAGAAVNATGPDEASIYTLPDSRQFRLPTAGDQQSVAGLDPEVAAVALLERCLVAGDPNEDADWLETAMSEMGAVLDLDLDAACPQCGTAQTVRFDIQTHLLRVLAYEKRFLNHEIHRIAMAYGWGYGEILQLTREDRRAFVRLIEVDRTPRRRTSAWLDI